MNTPRSTQRFFETIRLEQQGLESILSLAPETIAACIDLILSIKGKVVVTGMGKSGIIGQKIAATFASTGTPAVFVHPSEASHGDLGSIGADDLLIMLSNSGETLELFDVIRYAQVNSIPIIGLTRRDGSALAENSTIAIVVPPLDEACPHLLAPTTSTTQMLAVGDALAVTVMEIRGFTPDDFAMLHPGGKLGRLLSKAKDIMHTGDELPLVALDVSIKEAISAMMGRRYGCIGVVDNDQRLAGLVSDGDLRRNLNDDVFDQKVQNIMNPDPFTVGPDMNCLELIEVMNTKRITAVFVLDDDGHPEGIIDMHDLVRLRI
ncbi:MAG: KpsF/GutQ family sugar-phosphate isomerase [Alphaproteobacteria bacterium]|nr:KpsF/GutQ family sugar-phosphate isomerase [Alphaproteobacteria bacterium]